MLFESHLTSENSSTPKQETRNKFLLGNNNNQLNIVSTLRFLFTCMSAGMSPSSVLYHMLPESPGEILKGRDVSPRRLNPASFPGLGENPGNEVGLNLALLKM